MATPNDLQEEVAGVLRDYRDLKEKTQQAALRVEAMYDKLLRASEAKGKKETASGDDKPLAAKTGPVLYHIMVLLPSQLERPNPYEFEAMPASKITKEFIRGIKGGEYECIEGTIPRFKWSKKKEKYIQVHHIALVRKNKSECSYNYAFSNIFGIPTLGPVVFVPKRFIRQIL